MSDQRALASPGRARPAPPHVLAVVVVRPLLTVVALTAVYYMLPVDRALDGGPLSRWSSACVSS